MTTTTAERTATYTCPDEPPTPETRHLYCSGCLSYFGSTPSAHEPGGFQRVISRAYDEGVEEGKRLAVAELQAALILAHDHHEFGPQDCAPENCTAEAVIQTFATQRGPAGRKPLDETHGEKRPRRAIALGPPYDDGHTHAPGEPCDAGCLGVSRGAADAMNERLG